jgi:WD40 repeat protein
VELDADNLAILNEQDTSFTVWNFKKEIQDNCKYFDDHSDMINKIIVVQNRYIFSASADKSVKGWKIKNDQPDATLEGHTDSVLSIVYLDKLILASGSADKSIRIWNN